MSNMPTSKQMWVLFFVLLSCVSSLYLPAVSQETISKPGFEFVAIGDIPYTLEDIQRFPQLIQAINQQNPSFVVHVGDIFTGATNCSDENYRWMRRAFETFKAPLIYTPGDNEWTDCHRLFSGRYNPLERLHALRTLFYLTPPKLEKKLSLMRQNVAPGFLPYVENARWEKNGVLFLTLHIVGSNNNLQGVNPAEYQARNQANLAWLTKGFQLAESKKSQGIVIFMHADPFVPIQADKKSGFADFLSRLAFLTQTFKKPVLLVHGDSHVFRIDKPFFNPEKKIMENLTRVVVFASPHFNAVRVQIVPNAPSLFRVMPLFPAIASPSRSVKGAK